MMANLFSIFDPQVSLLGPIKWVAMAGCLFFMPSLVWVTKGRHGSVHYSVFLGAFTELSMALKNSPFTSLLPLSAMILILTMNLCGLLPYIFTPTSHLAFSLSIGAVAWVSAISFGIMTNFSSLLLHLTPQGTPMGLAPLMVLIELVSNLIRPITLSVRLAANMMAGHLLVSLLSGFTSNSGTEYPLMLSGQLPLEILELAVCCIQSYVFAILVTLYMSESSS